MKKIVSIILSIAVVLGCFAGAFSVSADTTVKENLATINFDEDHYINDTTGLYKNTNIELVNVDDIHGNAAKFTKISYSGVSSSSNGGKWKQSVKITNDSGKPVYFNAGETYIVSFDILQETQTQALSVYIGFIEDNGALGNVSVAFDDTNSVAVDWYGAVGERQNWCSSGDKTFTAPMSGYGLLLIMRSDSKGESGQSIYFDNIVVEQEVTIPDTPIENDGIITFDEDHYVNDAGQAYRNTNIELVNYDDTHGNAAKFTTISYSDVSSSSNSGKWKQNIKLADDDGAFYTFKKGKSYSISYDICRDVQKVGMSAYLLFLEGDEHSLGNISIALNAENSVELGNYDAVSSSSGWSTYKGEFVAPTNGYALLCIAYWSSDSKNNEIYFDNIAVREAVTPLVDSTMTFDEELYTTVAFDGGYTNGYHYAELIDSADGDHGKVIKFDAIAKVTSGNDGAWVDKFAFADESGKAPLKLTKGKIYKLTFDYKLNTATEDFSVRLAFVNAEDGVNLANKPNRTTDLNDTNSVTFADISAASGTGWATISDTFVAPDTNNVVVVLTGDSKKAGQDIYFDNVHIEEIEANTVTVMNTVDGQKDFVMTKGKAFEDIEVAPLAGAVVDGLYFDTAYTSKATGEITEAATVYVKWKSVALDNDSYLIANNHIPDPATDPVKYENEVYSGIGNSNALKIKHVSNGNWPYSAPILATDGSEFKTIAGHTYKLSFYFKSTENLTSSTPVLGIIKNAGGSFGTASIESRCFKRLGTDDPTMFHFEDIYKFDDTFYQDYRYFEFEFAAEEATSVYICPKNGSNNYIYIDDLKIVDTTMQNKVTLGDEVIFAGYDGETVDISDYDIAGDTNTVGLTLNGDAYNGGNILYRGDIAVEAETSQIAVTAATAKAGNKLSFRVNYSGMGFNKTDGGLENLTVTIGNVRYNVSEIGLLAAPKASGALTLETEGAKKLSNSDFKYSVAADGMLTAYADITVADIEAEYAVVGYIKTNTGVIYSDMRSSIAESYAKAADLELDGLDASAKVKTVDGQTYKLAWNSEFAEGSDISEKFGYMSSNTLVDDGAYMRRYVADSEHNYIVTDDDGSYYVGKSEMLGENEGVSTNIRSKYAMTTGYVEARIKFADNQYAAGAFWLNGAGINTGTILGNVSPEIDIVEFKDNASGAFTSLHLWNREDGGSHLYQKGIRKNNEQILFNKNTLNEWHTYGFLRTSDKMVVYVDGKEVVTINKNGVPLNGDIGTITAEQRDALFENPVSAIFGAGYDSANGQSADEADCEYYLDYIRFYE